MSDPYDYTAMLKPQDWSFPVPIAYGPGRLAEIGVQCAGLGIRAPLVVTDSGSAGLPFVSGLMSILTAAGMKASPSLCAAIASPVGSAVFTFYLRVRTCQSSTPNCVPALVPRLAHFLVAVKSKAW